MPKAHEVATELRKLADSLDSNPDTIVERAGIWFYCQTKDVFLNTVRLMPRPLTKRVYDVGRTFARIKISHDTLSVDTTVSVAQSLTCELVQAAKPAVYRCAPILSEAEDAEMEAAND